MGQPRWLRGQVKEAGQASLLNQRIDGFGEREAITTTSSEPGGSLDRD